MNTTENNKLIAEFMNLSIKDGVSYYTDEFDMFPMGIEVDDVFLPYDQSWDWLMPVVHKILWLSHYDDEYYEDIYSGLTNALISQTYDAVVEFIKRHNKI